MDAPNCLLSRNQTPSSSATRSRIRKRFLRSSGDRLLAAGCALTASEIIGREVPGFPWGSPWKVGAAEIGPLVDLAAVGPVV